MHRPVAVLVGSAGKLPVAGMTFHILNYAVGLRDLGYDVHYVERQNRRKELYDPADDAMTDDVRYALAYLQAVLPRFDVTPDRFSFIDAGGRCHGAGWSRLLAALDEADFVFTVADPTWFDDLERCARRAFVDGDPLFTQVAMIERAGNRGEAPHHYGNLFTFGTRIGQPDCAIPSAGREWKPTRPAVATRLWNLPAASSELPISALMTYRNRPEVTLNGTTYGQKDIELERFADLPSRTRRRILLAAGGGKVPRDRLRELGWELADPLAASHSIDAFQTFIAGSSAELGIAKHAYVASRSGWFSDRSVCYLAGGRPVLHQDTGYDDGGRTGKGVLFFSDIDELTEALDELAADYDRHCDAARALAREQFEASVVIGEMLDAAEFR